MDITQSYAVCVGLAIVLPTIVWVTRCISRVIKKNQHLFLKYVSCSWKITRLEALLMLFFLVVNVFCICFDVNSMQTIMHRSGLLSSINFIFLSFGHHMSYMFTGSGLKLSDYDHIHRLAAAIWIAEALVHSVIAAVLKMWRTDPISQVTTWTVRIESIPKVLYRANLCRRPFHAPF